MTHAFGEIEISQSVNAYKASIILSGETSLGKCIKISTSEAVLSSTFFILIFPFSLALRILSIREPVLVPYGISFIKRSPFSGFEILARALIFPPRSPSL